MDSIPQTAGFRLVPNGIIVTDQQPRNSIGFTDDTRAIRQVGDIVGFSKASRLRFRRIAASILPKDKTLEPWGCCLTIPGPIIEQSRAAKIWHSWCTNNCRRSFVDIPMLWRVELQQRRQPHWHLVCFLRTGREGKNQRAMYNLQWTHFIRKSLSEGCFVPWDEKTDFGFDSHGVRWQKLTRGQGCVDYLAPTLDHETKHKQEQLGWVGRQWGIVNRSLIAFDDGDGVFLWGDPVKRIICRFKSAQERRRALGREYVGAGVSDHWRLPAVLFGRDADTLACIVQRELDLLAIRKGR